MRGREGHALMELVVSLPILAIGGAAVAGIVITSGGLLLESERRLEVAIRGSELFDSLRVDGVGVPAEGSFEALGRRIGWAWDGAGSLELFGVIPASPSGGQEADEPDWTLRTHLKVGEGSSDGP